MRRQLTKMKKGTAMRERRFGRSTVWTVIALGLSAVGAVAPAIAAPAFVRLVKDDSGYRLNRYGKPYFIKGAGGDGSLKTLAEAGGNSIRTWDADKASPVLDEAQRLGLTVTVGIWLGHERHGFRYNDADQVARQYEQAMATILRFRDHPALLMWGIGNEMEGYEKGDNAAIWSAINNIASMAKKLDPNHPTMTVIAEIGGDKIKNVHRLCPDIDVVGINSYGGAATIPQRYRKAGGVKPYVLTEFGPPGAWESPKTSWGAAIEQSSTAKAEAYRRAYQLAVREAQGLCLGSYAFAWGHKQEATATWFGLLLPDGSRTGAVDVLTQLWTGKTSENRCPSIDRLTLDGPDQVNTGASVHATLEASDPESDPLTIRWVLQREGSHGSGGDAEPIPPSYPEAIVKASDRQVELRIPPVDSGYRLFAYVRDTHGGAATANVPLLVKSQNAGGRIAAKLPLVVYDENDQVPPVVPSGWMGDTKAIKLDPKCGDNPHSGKTCLRIDFEAQSGWGGVVWQDPPKDWGDVPGGLNLTGAKRLAFWARGAEGGETVTFAFGLLGSDKKYPDSSSGKLENAKLTHDWTLYKMPLNGKDLSRIKTPFSWTTAAEGKPVRFYLDDVKFE